MTPVPINSAARLRVSISRPALLAEYALAPSMLVPAAAPVDTLTIRPKSRASMPAGGGDDRDRRDEVEPYPSTPLRHAYAGQRSQRADVPSVVDFDVDRAELVRCDRSECVAAAADYRDPYAAVDQQARDRGTDAPTRAGHARDPARERRVAAYFSTRRNQISRQYG